MTEDPCPHDDWEIVGSNKVNHGTCLKCGEELRLDKLFNNWKARMDREWAEKMRQNLKEPKA